MMIRAVALDIDGTLYRSPSYTHHLYENIVRTIAEILNLKVDDAKKVLEEKRSKLLTVTRSIESMGIDRREFYKRVSDKVYPSKFIKPDNDVRNKLLFLKLAGLRLVAHTNSGKPLADKVLQALGLSEGIFDIVLTCNDAEPKPSLDGYKKICKYLGLKPSQIIYVGDRPEVELAPAKEIGMVTMQVGKERSKINFNSDYWANDIKDALVKIISMVNLK